MTKQRPTYRTVAARHGQRVADVFANEQRRYASGLVDATAADRAALTSTLRYLRRTSRGPANAARRAYFFGGK